MREVAVNRPVGLVLALQGPDGLPDLLGVDGVERGAVSPGLREEPQVPYAALSVTLSTWRKEPLS